MDTRLSFFFMSVHPLTIHFKVVLRVNIFLNKTWINVQEKHEEYSLALNIDPNPEDEEFSI